MASLSSPQLAMSRPACTSSTRTAHRQYCAPHTSARTPCPQRRSHSQPQFLANTQAKHVRRCAGPLAVSYAEPSAEAGAAAAPQVAEAAEVAEAAAPPAESPVHNPLQAPVPWNQAGQGLSIFADGSSSFRVWAPHAQSVTLQVVPPGQFVPAPQPQPAEDGAEGGGASLQERLASADLAQQPGLVEYDLAREGADWGTDLAVGAAPDGAAYRLVVVGPDGTTRLFRRDPWARSAEAGSSWCFVHSPAAYAWKNTEWSPLSYDRNIIYEMHIGSFTPEGTLSAAIAKLPHVASAGFTMLELMPCQEHSDPWGYNPRQLLALHRGIGTPEDMAAFVDAAHGLGMGVMMDVVLHHGAPSGNMLWDWDGWEEGHNGGIYHEGAPDCMWGRQWAFWKSEVRAMIVGATEAWLRDYRMDGLRFDSIKDVPMDMVQEITWALKQRYPGRILTAEITPEDPQLMAQYGFDAIWVHSGYFDIIQQHRALGRGHHGGGDWADGWDLARLREAMGVHYGFESPTQCIKYITGSHDQVGCQRNGGFYPDYNPIGGHHRYAVDQFCGGRSDPNAFASARLWYAANIGASGLPLMFMGTEMAQNGWWHTDEWHRLQWANVEDDIGRGMLAAVSDANRLRSQYPVLRYGWSNSIHEDRGSGVMGYERVAEGEARVIVVVNAARGSWQGGEYGLWVGGEGSFKQIYCSQDAKYGGSPTWVSNDVVTAHDGKIWINLPAQCTIMLVQQ